MAMACAFKMLSKARRTKKFPHRNQTKLSHQLHPTKRNKILVLISFYETRATLLYEKFTDTRNFQTETNSNFVLRNKPISRTMADNVRNETTINLLESCHRNMYVYVVSPCLTVNFYL